MRPSRARELPAAVLRHAFLIVMSALFLVPIYIAVVNVFKTREDIFANPLSMPLSRLTFANILRNISTPSFDLGIAYSTSLVLSGLTVALVVTMAAAMSYVISRKRQRLFKYAYLLLLAGLMVPAQVIPDYSRRDREKVGASAELQ